MGIESTMTVKRIDALEMLKAKRCTVYENDCLERLSDLLYEHRESEYENYIVVENNYKGRENERWKFYW